MRAGPGAMARLGSRRRTSLLRLAARQRKVFQQIGHAALDQLGIRRSAFAEFARDTTVPHLGIARRIDHPQHQRALADILGAGTADTDPGGTVAAGTTHANADPE